MKPLIFLDIDGVLNHPGCYERFEKAMENLSLEEAERYYDNDIHVELLFDETCVKHLNTITTEVDAEIVLSSSWRHRYWNKRDRFHNLVKRIDVKAPIIDFTPSRGTGGHQRGDEIRTWLRANRKETQMVVLDDDDDMLAVKKWFVQTDATCGLNEISAKKALEKLRERPWTIGSWKQRAKQSKTY